MAETKIYPTTDELNSALARAITEHLTAAIAAHGVGTLALSGGSTPRALYTLLAHPPFATAIDWQHVHLFWGDERTVPPDHAASNYRMVRESLLDHIAIPAANCHRMKAEFAPAAAAEDYARELAAFCAAYPQVPTVQIGTHTAPIIDIVLLGVGNDGHTASLFPGTTALAATDAPVVAVEVPQHNTWRITFTYPFINAAAHVWFQVAGSGKAHIIRAIIAGEHQPAVLPSQGIQPTSAPAIWWLDQPAAAELSSA